MSRHHRPGATGSIRAILFVIPLVALPPVLTGCGQTFRGPGAEPEAALRQAAAEAPAPDPGIDAEETIVEPDRNEWIGDYEPFKPGNRLVRARPDAAFRFQGEPPRVTGPYGLYPAYAAAFQALAAAPPDRLADFLALEGSDTIFHKLNEREADLIFALRPSPRQVERMRAAGLRYVMTPVLRSAFVFFVRRDNPARGLTQDQLRAIYSGEATTWRELGVPLDDPLVPYQRNEDSGSQTRFERFMGDRPIMDPPTITRERIGGMGRIIKMIANADYRNSRGAIGFTFRFYATELIKNPNIKLLAVDGVEPTLANIANGSYPLITEGYVVTARPREGNTARMIGFLRSPEGRRMIEATGFAPAPEDAEDIVLE